MSEVTRILSAIEAGDPCAEVQLLPLVYDELRRLAAAQMAREKPGHTLDATALVHEAWLRLVGDQHFENRRHFFLAAAEAMRRILVEAARKKKSLKRGGDRQRQDLFEDQAAAVPDDELVALDEALERLAVDQPRMADLVQLRFFAGLTLEQAARALAVSLRTAKRDWTFARAWLRREMDREN